MSAKAFEQLAADAVVDALHWKTRARNAEDNARELLAALEHLTRAVKIKGPMGTTAYLHADADMRAALEAIAKATGGAE